MAIWNFKVQFQGKRPLMFDRYAGDNNTSLRPEEKMYLTSQGQLIMPAINLMSLLCSENTKSVTRQFFGKSGRKIAMAIASYTVLEPFEIPILCNGKPIFFTGFNGQISVHQIVARLKNGVPNPKQRPMLALPWEVNFTVSYQDNKEVTIENLRQALHMGGSLGLGTFRPYYGLYEMTLFEKVATS